MSIETRREKFPTEDSLQLATEAAAIGVWDLAIPSNEVQWSNRCNEIFGLPLDAELKYEDFLERVHAEDRARVDGVVQSVLDPNGAGDYDIEYRIVRPNNEIRWVAAKGRAFFRQGHEQRRPYRFMGTMMDRTEHKQTQQALIESEKLGVTGRLAASIAHEIRNPLEAVSNILHLLKDERSEQRREHYVALAQEELKRATEIATDTLRFYRDPADLDPSYDLAEFINSVTALFQGRMRPCRIKLHTRVEAGISLRISQGELRQIVVNLIGNALDALSPGGSLSVRVHSVSGGQRKQVLLTVADTGAGMTPMVRARLFEAFYTTKGSSGNGIGLWLCREILKKHASSIRVKSAPGKGTAFTLFLT